jgi:hypothetical protein
VTQPFAFLEHWRRATDGDFAGRDGGSNPPRASGQDVEALGDGDVHLADAQVDEVETSAPRIWRC